MEGCGENLFLAGAAVIERVALGEGVLAGGEVAVAGCVGDSVAVGGRVGLGAVTDRAGLIVGF